MEELRTIRELWVVEKHEIEDLMPEIYREATGEPYPDPQIHDGVIFGSEELRLLREICAGDPLQYELIRNLLDTEVSFRSLVKRKGLYSELEGEIARCFFEDEDDAKQWALANQGVKDSAPEGEKPVASLDS